MIKDIAKTLAVLTATGLLLVSVFDSEAFARAGGGRSYGSRGTRSVSPSRTYQSSPTRQQPPSSAQPAQQPMQQAQPAGGGFLRSMGGGLLGGMLGGMLFGSLFGMRGGFGGSGIGLIEILLLAGAGFIFYRMFTGRRTQQQSASANSYGYQDTQSSAGYSAAATAASAEDEIARGLSNLRQMDPSFDETRFRDEATDIFFKVQGAWMNRNISSVSSLLTDEMARNFQSDIDGMIREKKVNRLENIAMREVDIAEIWQETGQDFITLRVYANLLDYTTDDATGAVVSGSKTDPVKFEEYWTFTRPVGNNRWKLSAIEQAA